MSLKLPNVFYLSQHLQKFLQPQVNLGFESLFFQIPSHQPSNMCNGHHIQNPDLGQHLQTVNSNFDSAHALNTGLKTST